MPIGTAQPAYRYSLAARADSHPYSFLIIDGSPGRCKQLARLLTQLDGKVVGTTANHNEALTIFRKFYAHIDVVILDAELAAASVYTMLKELQAINPRARVIAITAHPYCSLVKKLVAAGAAHCLTAPYRIKQLFQACQTVLRN